MFNINNKSMKSILILTLATDLKNPVYFDNVTFVTLRNTGKGIYLSILYSGSNGIDEHAHYSIEVIHDFKVL